MEELTFNQTLQEAFEHLLKGRGRIAMPLAEQLYNEKKNDSLTAVCYSWALLENNDPINAERLMKLSSELPGDTFTARMYRAYVQMRLSSFEGAIYDFNMTEGKQKELLAWTYLNKAKALAAINELEKASSFFTLALMIDNNANPEWKKLKVYFQKAQELKKLSLANAKEYIELCIASMKQKEYWFALLVVKALMADNQILNAFPAIEFLEPEIMYKLNQFTPALEKIKKLKLKYPEEEKIKSLEQAIVTCMKKGESSAPKSDFIVDKTSQPKISTSFYPSTSVDVFSMKIYDMDKDEKDKVYYSAVNIREIQEIGVEIIFNNPFLNKSDQKHRCFLAWYLDDDLIDQTNFEMNVPKDWDAMLVTRSSDLRKIGRAHV